MKASKEFKVGKHAIGFINSTFEKEFGDIEFGECPLPTFQKLPRNMNDAEIESELKPGFCELGDILAFLDNAPDECKDGYANLFYTPSFVVSVGWSSFGRGWGVSAWGRGGAGWRGGMRVFSPAGSFEPENSDLGYSETLNLDQAINLVRSAGYKIFKEV